MVGLLFCGDRRCGEYSQTTKAAADSARTANKGDGDGEEVEPISRMFTRFLILICVNVFYFIVVIFVFVASPVAVAAAAVVVAVVSN